MEVKGKYNIFWYLNINNYYKKGFKMKKLIFLLFSLVFLTSVNAFALSTELIENGNFDNGLTGWSTTGDVVLGTNGNTAYLQGNYAILGKKTSVGLSTLTQSFFIENSIEEVSLSFDMVFKGFDRSIIRVDDAKAIFSQTISAVWGLVNFDYYTYLEEETSPTSQDSFTVNISYRASLLISDYLSLADPNAAIIFQLSESVGSTDSKLFIDNVSVIAETTNPVPEPATMILLGTGLVGLAGVRRRKK